MQRAIETKAPPGEIMAKEIDRANLFLGTVKHISYMQIKQIFQQGVLKA